MEHKKELEELHKKSLDKIDEYLKTKKNLSGEHHEKLKEAKKNWQSSWTGLMDVLMYLETLEI
jgi:restriction endonuclease S subunit